MAGVVSLSRPALMSLPPFGRAMLLGSLGASVYAASLYLFARSAVVSLLGAVRTTLGARQARGAI